MAEIQAAQLASLTAEVRYPIGLVDLEYATLSDDGQPQLPTSKIRLILSSTDARRIAEQFQKVALAIEAIGGKAQ